jgi:hypothetical protein
VVAVVVVKRRSRRPRRRRRGERRGRRERRRERRKERRVDIAAFESGVGGFSLGCVLHVR